MGSTITIAELNRQGRAAVRKAKQQGQVSITDHGKTVAFLLSADKVEAMLETLEVLGDPKAMTAIREYEAGKTKMKDVSCLDDE